MALRVLLADESTTIKKVMQLALQDFAIDVKAVHVGVDVLEVARTFSPDIIFADILLQKKNGYEVCNDLKNDPQLKSVPVVLMWSSFMEFDENQAVRVRAEGRLEKPFDVEVLRKLVLELVPKTRTQRLAHFLEFSDKLSEPMKAEVAKGRTPEAASPAPKSAATPPPLPKTPPPIQQAPPPPAPAPKEEPSTWDMGSFEDLGEKDSFTSLNLAPKTQPKAVPAAKADDGEPWSHQDLSRFKIELPPVSVQTDDLDLKIDLGEDEFSTSDFVFKTEPKATPTQSKPQPPPPTMQEFEIDSDDERQTARIETEGHEEIREETVDTFSLTKAMGGPSSDTGSHEAIPMFEASLDADFGLAVEEELTEEAPTPIEPAPSFAENPTTMSKTKRAEIPQLDANRLEEIIRAQSRDIIEDVVRRIVPDLAENIIRAELDRLLKDAQ